MNLRSIIYVNISLLLLVIIALTICSITNSSVIDKKTALNKRIGADILNNNTSHNIDWRLLDSLISNKQMILLGEQQHADGTTQKILSELVLYLNQKGFNTLFLETSFYDTHRFWERLQLGQVNDFHRSTIYPFWKNAEQTKLLRDTIIFKSKKKSPLYLKGIDFQIPIKFSQHKIYEDLISYAKQVPGFKQSQIKHVKHSLTNRFGPVLYFNTPGDRMDTNRKSCLKELLDLQDLINKKESKTEKDSLYLRYINNIYHFYYSKMYLKDNEFNNTRDSVMFSNILWQMNKNKLSKAIVWTANAHASNDKNQWIRIGTHIKEHYDKNSLIILTTSLNGSTTNISSKKVVKLNPSTSLTVETTLAERIEEHSILVVPHNLKKQKSTMRFYGHNNIEDDWFNKFDAFIFIKNMQPSKY